VTADRVSGPPVLVEACVESAPSALVAASAGVGRVELCANLVEGGTTPSAGTIALAAERLTIPCFVMIRPRGGDFCYSPDELEIMGRDIDTARDAGADGVVFGCLAPEGIVARDATAALVDRARPLPVTFHRAFDLTRDPVEALDTLLALGVDRVLTSGQRDAVTDALPLVRDLVDRAGRDLVVMPGGGVRAENVAAVVAATGAREVHVFTERAWPSPMTYRNPGVPMGRAYQPDEYVRTGADAEVFARVVNAVRE
jgi:copper homeostasis protein